jgi:hypothetical protein
MRSVTDVVAGLTDDTTLFVAVLGGGFVAQADRSVVPIEGREAAPEQDGEQDADPASDHEDDAAGVDVEAVLVTGSRDGEAQDGSDRGH